MTMIEVIVQGTTPSIILLPLLFAVLYGIYRLSKQDSSPSSTLPWVDGRQKLAFFSRTTTSKIELLQTGYQQYSKKDQSYIFPNPPKDPDIVIPRSSMKWLLDQPDSVASSWAMHYDGLEGEYAFTDKRVVGDPWHERVIHKSLSRHIGAAVPEIWEEIVLAFSDVWGRDEKEVIVFATSMDIISQVSNRIFIGQPLCRNKYYLSACQGFAQQVMPTAILLSMIPKSLRFFLRPIFGPLFSQVGKSYWKTAAKYSLPVIKEHLISTELKDTNPTYEWMEPNIYLSWHVRLAQEETKPQELDPDLISRRLMALNFASIHTTTITVTNLLFDLFSSDPKLGYVEGIREEVTRVFSDCGGLWSKVALTKLIRTDSAVRESMRVSCFFSRGLMHKVVAPDGLRNDQEGYTIPKGTNVGMDVKNIMNDPEIYSQPKVFDAFRFSRPREAYEASNVLQKDPARELEFRRTSLVTTSGAFFSFGHGRHACPGRFFVSHELKLMVAYIVMNYDIELLADRPSTNWMGETALPSFRGTLRIKWKAQQP